jgi:hypothetical protein
MGQILHSSAKTTHAVRAAIQRSKASIQELASRYDLNGNSVCLRNATARASSLGAEYRSMIAFMRRLYLRARAYHKIPPGSPKSHSTSEGALRNACDFNAPGLSG